MKQRLATWLLHLAGWRLEGVRPALDRYVLIAAPHTSNWDLLLVLAFAVAYDLKVTWMAKHSLFYPPFGCIMRALGGIPVTTHKHRHIVAAMTAAFKTSEHLVLALPTEGCRQRTPYWRSGFYHIAKQAGVPIVPSYLDFSHKRGGFGPSLETTSDVKQDMQYFSDFYAEMESKYSGQFGPVQLREEQPREE
jgi:1-acyl-sn-glycerol-3-phosphate acyltransferase